MAVRVADAMTRGAWCHDNVTGADSIDFLRIDWFGLADRPVDEVRDRFSLRPRSAGAVAAGSATPWEPGGISPFQLSSGREAAARDRSPLRLLRRRARLRPAPHPLGRCTRQGGQRPSSPAPHSQARPSPSSSRWGL